jgi:threonine/homoserine/homoserine lactone efflux protein
MSFETWLAFAAASTILIVIPGPTILLVVSYALGKGWRSALPMAVGVALGDCAAMTASIVGLGALLSASATLYTILKWIGAAYLIWLGIKLWRAGGTLDARPVDSDASPVKMLLHAFIVTALNPKGLTFFVAFLPQFVGPNTDFWQQMLIFEATFIGIAFVNAFGYAVLASRARNFVRSEKLMTNINRAGGSLLIGAGVMAAFAKAR